jgi:PPOX class probable F420-dependent enzyme
MTVLPELVRTLLEQASLAHVATVLPDGSPHSVPVWIDLEDDRAAFLTAPGSRKARNLAGDPRVCVSLTAADAPTTMAHIRGRVTERVDGDRGWAIIDRVSDKYLGQPYPLREDRVVFLVEIEHAWGRAFA